MVNASFFPLLWLILFLFRPELADVQRMVAQFAFKVQFRIVFAGESYTLACAGHGELFCHEELVHDLRRAGGSTVSVLEYKAERLDNAIRIYPKLVPNLTDKPTT